MKYAFRAVLVLIIAANGLGLATLLADQQALRAIYPQLQPWMLPVLIALSIASMVACVALWGWRRWGFVLLFSAYGLLLMVNLGFAAPLAHTALGPLGLLILAAVSWPVRHLFRG